MAQSRRPVLGVGMSCTTTGCNHQCAEGCTCPARVAKVGQRWRAADPLPSGRWYLRELAAAMLLVAAVMLAAFVAGVFVAFFN